MFALYLCGAIAVALFIYLLYILHYPKNYAVMNRVCDGTRGPVPLPVIGYFLYPVTTERVTHMIRKMCRKYGSPMYGKIGPLYGCLITTAEHAEILLSQPRNIEKAFMYNLLRPFFGNGLFTSKGDEWHRQRKMLRPGFNFRFLEDSIPAMNEKASIHCDSIRNQAQNGNALEVHSIATRLALDTLMATAFGTQLNEQSDSASAFNDYAYYMAEFIDLFIQRAPWPFLWTDFTWNLTSKGRRSKAALKFLQEFSANRISERDTAQNKNSKVELDENGDAQKKAFIDLLLDLKRNGQMSLKDVHEQVNTFIFGGYDTIATSMTWTLWCLATHTDAQDRLRQELSDVLRDNQSGWPTSTELSQMKWLECCLKESLRLFPPAPVFGRNTDSPICIDGENTLPAATLIGVDLYQLQRDPKHWPEPDLFKPERFLPENSEGRHPFSFLPFSGGIRNCIGQKYAMISMKVIFVHIVRAFMLSTDQTYIEKDAIYALILRPKNGMWIKFKSIDEEKK